jgi:hypothetical protein
MRSPAVKILGGGTAAVYPTISECDRALNALTLRTAPYDPDYVEGLYSDYTCSDDDDDVYPEAKGKVGNSASSASPCESVASSDGYIADYDSDFMNEVGPYVESDNVYLQHWAKSATIRPRGPGDTV